MQPALRGSPGLDHGFAASCAQTPSPPSSPPCQAELANERAAAALQLQLRGTQHDVELGKVGLRLQGPTRLVDLRHAGDACGLGAMCVPKDLRAWTEPSDQKPRPSTPSKQVRAALDRTTSELAGARERQEAALHQAALARAARDRASAESARREDEVVGLRVRLEGLEASLGEYRAENAKAAGMKARYKAIIGELEASLGAKEREKSALVAMCDELMTTLERERQQLARQQAPR